MKKCDWCHKPIRWWQRRHDGWLHLEHSICHAKRRANLLAVLGDHNPGEVLSAPDLDDAYADGLLP